MHRTTNLDRRTCPGSTRARFACRSGALAIAAALAMGTACRDFDHGSIPTSPTVTGPVALSLVGIWKGAVSGSGGNSTVVMRLDADSTMAADNENSNYTHIDGVWAVSDGWFTATGRTAAGTTVTLRAPVKSSVRLVGTWSADNGASGSFAILKQ